MARSFVTPAQRKRRILRDALLLAVVLVVLILRLDFPILTAEQALEATQDRYFFGPGEVITTLDYSREANKVKIGQYDRYYILRHGDWYAWCGVNHYGLFWQTGGLDAVENNPDLPLVPLVVSDWNSGAVLVISNDPEITQVEITFPISAETKQGYTLLSASQTESTENCFLIPYTSGPGFVFPEDLQVKGYDAAGALRYQSPIPESWATRYELR
ncbi:DUF5044 domain-containing protein [Flavonifractor sp. An112]|uniref:DUF5044 domain-containing protein n=1 Tax=Flavonifractor sp. An112 TaxID=1965544 RepID=UPI00174E9E14|nr:DUF5044 domain-containing protein [Flavonifractor sp. An112]HIZ93983.1 DUF5044 domain-containing protein [Candidatus Flavonifractor avicola]